MMILGMDFKFRDDLVASKMDTVAIELIAGPYKGIVYRYTKVNVKVDTDKDLAVLKFGYDLLELPKTFKQKILKKDKKFQEYLGLILNTLILEISDMVDKPDSLTDDIVDLGETGADREIDFKELVKQ